MSNAFYEFGGSIEFVWDPQPEVIAQEIFEIAGYLENTLGPIELSKEIVRQDVRARFESKTTPYGEQWAPWARNYPDSESILIKTGALRDAASGDAVGNTEDTVFFNFGELPFYGVFHEYGAVRSGGDAESRASDIEFLKRAKALGMSVSSDFTGGGGNRLPARPFAGASFEAEAKIVAVFDMWFQGAIGLGRTKSGKVFPRHTLRGPGGRFIPKAR